MPREPEKRHAQRALARDVTQRVHGDTAVREAEAAAQALFSDRISSLTLKQIEETLAGVPSLTIPMAVEGWLVLDLLAGSGVTKSKSEAQRLIRGGGLYINDRRITDEKEQLTVEHAVDGKLFVVRKGKRENLLVWIR